MTLKEYIIQTRRTRPSFSEMDKKLAQAGMGLAGETGEVVDLIKKIIFQKKPLDKEKLKEELGDIFWYLAYIIDILEISPEKILEDNINKLKIRYPDGFSTKSANERRDIK